MPDQGPSDLTAGTAPAGTEVFHGSQGGNSRGFTATQMNAAVGTSFPGSPATNDRFYRTDRDIDYYYDGAQWLSTALYSLSLGGFSTAATANSVSIANPAASSYSIYAIDAVVSKVVSGTGNWTISVKSLDAAAEVALGSTSAFTNTAYDHQLVAIGSVVANTIDIFYMTFTENSGTGTCFGHGALNYRLVG